MLKARKFKTLESAIGYRFKSQALVERALTHASVRGGKAARLDNERLEFIGDRVLGLAIAEVLGELYPDANEGELAKRYNRLVRREACARVGNAIGLGEHLIMSASEADSGGRQKATIIADAIEALLGAVFIDGGFDKARIVIRKLWNTKSESAADVVVDAKSTLQEWAQGRGLPLPVYKVVSRNGPDHAPNFTAEVTIASKRPAQGEGPSKRIAEQEAAKALLKREGVKMVAP